MSETAESKTDETTPDQGDDKADDKAPTKAAAKKAPAKKPAAKKAAAKASSKKAPAKKQTGKAARAAKSAKAAEAARNTIYKHMQQKPVAMNLSQMGSVPTGSSSIDNLIGGSPAKDGSGPVCPGFPRKYISEVYGPESSGKTTLALSSIVQIQQAGGLAMFLDFEHALHHGYAKEVGVDFNKDKLLLFAPETLEQGIKMIFVGIHTGVDLVVVDSVASMVPKSEMDKKPDAAAKVGAQARAFSTNLPKIVNWLHGPKAKKKNPEGTAVLFLNQERAFIDTSGGRSGPKPREGTVNTSGGKALKFYAYLRLMLTKKGTDSIKRKDKFTGKERTYPFGNHTTVKVVKSKVDAKQGHSCEMFIRYGMGIDDIFSIIQGALTNKLIKKEGGGWYEYGGERLRGKDKLRDYLVENPKVFAKLKGAVLAAVVLEDTPQELDEEDDLVANMDDIFGDDDDGPEESEILDDDGVVMDEPGE